MLLNITRNNSIEMMNSKLPLQLLLHSKSDHEKRAGLSGFLLTNQMAYGGRLARVNMANDHDVNVRLLIDHG
jgi:hypothetical protein